MAAIRDELSAIRQHLDGTSPSSPAAGDEGEGVPSDDLTGMPVHVGGPWYRLPDGSKVKGKAEAQRRAAQLRG